MLHSMLPLFMLCTITEFCVRSLALDNQGQKYCQTLGNKPLLAMNSLRTQKGTDQYLYSRGKTFTPYVVTVCFTRYTLLFQYVCLLFPICLPCVIFDMYVTRIHAVSWHTTQQKFASLGLFTFARIAWILQLWIKTSVLDYSIWATPK